MIEIVLREFINLTETQASNASLSNIAEINIFSDELPDVFKKTISKTDEIFLPILHLSFNKVYRGIGGYT